MSFLEKKKGIFVLTYFYNNNNSANAINAQICIVLPQKRDFG